VAHMPPDFRRSPGLDRHRDDAEILRNGVDCAVTEPAHGTPGGPEMDQDRPGPPSVEIESPPVRELPGQGRGSAVGEGPRLPPVHKGEDRQDQEQVAEPTEATPFGSCIFRIQGRRK